MAHALPGWKDVIMIRRCLNKEFEIIYEVINDGARAYQGAIPDDRWHEPYMTRSELKQQIKEGVEFWGFDENGTICGVMGIQEMRDVALIRHAYVRTNDQRRGVGGQLLEMLHGQSTQPFLIGMWKDATWAIRFYEKHGFKPVPKDLIQDLLGKYWSIPKRQVETSTVLADDKWFKAGNRPGNRF